MAGTAEFGGVVACLGDDHTGESSTVLHHSEFALVDAMMPILSPAGVQEVLDYGLLGWALSRYTGCWVGLKCVKDTIEVTEVVDGDPHRLKIVTPADFAMPEGGLNIRRGDTPVAQEARLHDYKRFAAEAFARANGIDRRVLGDARAKHRHRLLRQVLARHPARPRPPRHRRRRGASASGITTYKVGMVWPLDMASFREWAHDLEHIIVVEEKRKLIEVQIKEAIFDDRRGRRVTGWKNEAGETIFSVKQALDPVKVARTLGTLLALDGVETDALARPPRAARRRGARRQRRGDRGPQALVLLRLPAQHLDPAARRRPRLRRHRLPLHGALDGPRHRGIHPHGRRGRQLDRRGAVLHPPPRLPEPRRRHLQPLRRPGDPRRPRRGRQHHLQDPLQRRRRDDRRPAQRGRPHRAADRPRAGRHGREARRRRLRPQGGDRPQVLPAAGADARARRPRRRAARDAGGRRRLGDHLHPDLRRREAPPPQARPVPRPRPPRLHQPRRLRGLRRLRRAVELRLDPAARDRVRPQAR